MCLGDTVLDINSSLRDYGYFAGGEEEENDDGEGADEAALPWYKEHEEAFILAGIGALVVGGVAIARSLFRR